MLMSYWTQGLILSVVGPGLLALGAAFRGYRGCRMWVTATLSWCLLVAYYLCLALVAMQIAQANSQERMLTRQSEEIESLSHYLPDGTHVLFMIVFGWGYGAAASAVGASLRKRSDKNTSSD